MPPNWHIQFLNLLAALRLPNEPAARASQGRLGILGKYISMAVLGHLDRWLRICWHSRQMVLGNLGRWPRICWHSRQMVLGFLAYGPGFLGIWSRISQQMAKNLSVFLADCPEFLGKVGQEFVSILGRWSRFCQ